MADHRVVGRRAVAWAVVGIVLLVLSVMVGHAQDWSAIGPGCRTGGRGSSAHEAVSAYYRRCISKPSVKELRQPLHPYYGYIESREYVIDSPHRTRFVIVGRRQGSAVWTVDHQGEGTGP